MDINFQNLADILDQTTAVILDMSALSYPQVERDEEGVAESIIIAYEDDSQEIEHSLDDTNTHNITIVDNKIWFKINEEIYSITALKPLDLSAVDPSIDGLYTVVEESDGVIFDYSALVFPSVNIENGDDEEDSIEFRWSDQGDEYERLFNDSDINDIAIIDGQFVFKVEDEKHIVRPLRALVQQEYVMILSIMSTHPTTTKGTLSR